MNQQNIDEQTVLDQNEEKTMLDNQERQAATPKQAAEAGEKRNGVWKKVAVGTGTGIVMGAASAVLTSGKLTPEDVETEEARSEDVEAMPEDVEAMPEDVAAEEVAMSFDHIGVATGVSDNMSFSEAFAAARTEVGTGGVFVWHGKLYNTFTAEEWDNMTTEEHNDFASHISYTSYYHYDHHSTAHNQTPDENVAVHPGEDTQVVEVVDTGEETHEVEVLGVVHDNETGYNVGGMIIDGHEAMVVDVDNDQVFDGALIDQNNDGQFSDDEIHDISDMGLTVDDLGGFTDPVDNTILANNETDYTQDTGIYEA